MKKNLTYNKKNCLYISDGPDEIRFEPPNIQNNPMINIKENDTVGPLKCIVHCNPLCETIWKYKISNGQTNIISQEKELQKQNLKRDMVSFHCEVNWRSKCIMEKKISLNVLCK